MLKFTESKMFEDRYRKMAEHSLDRYFEAKKAIDEKEAIVQEFLDMMRTQDSDVMTDLLSYNLVKEHRTNQQSIIKNLFTSLKKYVGLTQTDARNEAAVNWLKEITKDEQYFPYV